jgi:hypothetical protein
MYLKKVLRKKHEEEKQDDIFCRHLESHQRKEPDPDF